MPRCRDVEVFEDDLRGFRYFKMLRPLLRKLHSDATERDRAGNRKLFYDHYVTLLLLYYFSPALTSLRALEQASGLGKVQDRLGIDAVSRSAFGEAAHVFDPALLRALFVELAGQTLPRLPRSGAPELAGLVAVDGTPLPALPR